MSRHCLPISFLNFLNLNQEYAADIADFEKKVLDDGPFPLGHLLFSTQKVCVAALQCDAIRNIIYLVYSRFSGYLQHCKSSGKSKH
jgi:hypothetical protein